jgi:hypothetical protein
MTDACINAGGVAGFNSGTIEDAYAAGSINISGGGCSSAGGIVATIVDGTLTRSYANVNITSAMSSNGCAVGLQTNGNITNSFASCNITAAGGDNCFLGALFGLGTQSNNYHESSITKSCTDDGGTITARTPAQLRDITLAPLNGWDMTIWQNNNSVSQFPTLR